MRASLPRRAGELASLILLLGAGAVSALALFGAGGSSYGPLVWVGALVLVLAGVGVALAPWPQLDRTGLACLASLTAFVVWIGVTMLWSITPDRSWEYANRGFVYLAFLLLGLLIGGRVRVVAAGALVLLAAVLAWALAGKVLPDLFPDGARIARLRDPIGYWNGLALVAAMVMPLGLWAAVRREHHRAARTASVVVLFAATVALLLTYSRGGVVVALVAVGVYLAFSRERVEAIAALALALPAAVVVTAWAFSQPGLVDDHQSYDDRLRAGILLGVLLVVVGAVVTAGTYAVLAHEDEWRPRFRWNLTGPRLVGGAAAALAVAVLAVSGGHPGGWVRDGFREFANPRSGAGSDPSRIGSFSSNSRWTWWTEAWTLFKDRPIGGTGAASFAVARRPIRSNTTYAVEPHNIALQFLAETGVVGFLLFAGFVAAAAVGIVGAIRRLPAPEAAAGAALAIAVLAYLLHALIDYDWDFVALTGPVLIVLGVLLAAGRGTQSRPWWAPAAVLVSAAAIFSLAAPWEADRDVEDAYAALAQHRPRRGLDEAHSARRLNPVSIEPLFALAAADEALGRDDAALEHYVEAVELQPENFRTWYELGRFELSVGLHGRGVEHLRRARELDPLGPANDLLVTMGL